MLYFHPGSLGKMNPIWRIFFKGIETTNQISRWKKPLIRTHHWSDHFRPNIQSYVPCCSFKHHLVRAWKWWIFSTCFCDVWGTMNRANHGLMGLSLWFMLSSSKGKQLFVVCWWQCCEGKHMSLCGSNSDDSQHVCHFYFLTPTWRIIPVSKWLVSPICRPLRPFGTEATRSRGDLHICNFIQFLAPKGSLLNFFF